jgi:mRNA-degrading endonuclease RelE of RelBE toxin-antitoxin system
MKAVFMELPAFERHREEYFSDAAFARLQELLMENPEAGDRVPGMGGIRKLRFGDARRQKGKRGGLRVIYYWWIGGFQFWLFGVYDKEALKDLSPAQTKIFRKALKAELKEINAK